LTRVSRDDSPDGAGRFKTGWGVETFATPGFCPAEYNAFENDRLPDGVGEAIKAAQHEFSKAMRGR
jgi:hypothetical protein